MWLNFACFIGGVAIGMLFMLGVLLRLPCNEGSCDCEE